MRIKSRTVTRTVAFILVMTVSFGLVGVEVASAESLPKLPPGVPHTKTAKQQFYNDYLSSQYMCAETLHPLCFNYNMATSPTAKHYRSARDYYAEKMYMQVMTSTYLYALIYVYMTIFTAYVRLWVQVFGIAGRNMFCASLGSTAGPEAGFACGLLIDGWGTLHG